MTVATAAAALLAQWVLPGRALNLPKRVPVEISARDGGGGLVDLKGFFRKGDGVASAPDGAWPGFRGPRRDNISTDSAKLARSWPAAGPAKLWQCEVGEGYAGAAVAGGRLYLLDYDPSAGADVLRCLSAADGREIWRRGYAIEIGRNHGISRTVCAVADGCVVSIGPKCHVLCADATTGDFKWGIDLVREYGATVPPWYTGQNPLIENGRVILAPGGKCLLMAVELSSGRVLWQAPNPRGWQMTHSSVVRTELNDRRLYLYCTSGGAIGAWGDDGSIAFELPQWKVGMANVPSPLPLPDNRVLFTGGYGAGSMMVRLVATGTSIKPEILYRLPPEVFGAEQHTPVFYKGFIYGVIPVSAQLVCLSLDGKQVWSSGGKYRFGLGPYLLAGGMILLLNDAGTLTLVEATEAAFKPITQARLFEHGHEAWGPMALVNGKLFARDLTRLACFDLREVTHE